MATLPETGFEDYSPDEPSLHEPSGVRLLFAIGRAELRLAMIHSEIQAANYDRSRISLFLGGTVGVLFAVYLLGSLIPYIGDMNTKQRAIDDANKCVNYARKAAAGEINVLPLYKTEAQCSAELKAANEMVVVYRPSADAQALTKNMRWIIH
jgi:hypothetical protein